MDRALEKPERFTAGAGLEALLPALARNIDHMDRAVALAGDEQFVAAVGHVHRLTADLDRGLLAERRVDQTHGVAVEAGDSERLPVGAVAGDLGGFRHILEADGLPDLLRFCVDEKQNGFLVRHDGYRRSVARDCDARQWLRRLDLA